MHGAAVSFVRTGDPGWPRWMPDERATRMFGAPPSVPTVVADGYASVRALVG